MGVLLTDLVWMMISAGVQVLFSFRLEVELRGKVEPWGEGTSIEVGSHRSTGLQVGRDEGEVTINEGVIAKDHRITVRQQDIRTSRLEPRH